MENRFEVKDGQAKRGHFPLCELRAVYKCQLCETEHVAIARARGSNMNQKLAKDMLGIIKVDLVNKFFQEHPKARVEEFVIGLVSAEEQITYEQGGDIEKDNIGIPWVTYDIEQITGRKASVDDEKVKPKEPVKKEVPLLAVDRVGINEINKESPLKDLEKMSFADLSADGMEKVFRQKLKEVVEREQQLKVEVMLLAHERAKYETMITAIEAVEKQRKEDIKSE